MVRAGHPGWTCWGGHGSGRKLPIVFAGPLLGDDGLANINRSFPKVSFGEDEQTAYGDCWTDPELKFVLALKHEAGGLLLASSDGGKSFAELGKGYGPGWIFDGRTAVVATVKSKEAPTPRLLRTTDAGKTFKPRGDFSPVGRNSTQALPKWRDGALYWLTESGSIVTTDTGKTWKQRGALKDTQYGPVFGKDAKHMFVLTKTGMVESADGGVTWSKPLAPPPALKGIGGLSWLEYDPKHDTLYLMKRGSDLYRLDRKK